MKRLATWVCLTWLLATCHQAQAENCAINPVVTWESQGGPQVVFLDVIETEVTLAEKYSRSAIREKERHRLSRGVRVFILQNEKARLSSTPEGLGSIKIVLPLYCTDVKTAQRDNETAAKELFSGRGKNVNLAGNWLSLAESSNAFFAKSERDWGFPAPKLARDYSWLHPYCARLQNINKLSDFRSYVLDEILPEYNPTQFWTASYCEPQHLAQAKSPLLHVLAERPAKSLPLVREAKRWFTEGLGRPEEWVKVVNASNSRGYTTLDYIESIKGTYLSEEAGQVSEMIALLCSEGGTYSAYQKVCTF